MYKKDSFDNYPVFKKIIDKYGMNNFLDPLTRTILRGHIMSYIEDLIEQKKPFSLIIIDIDNFKQINDNYGHKIGDEVLRITAKRIIDTVGDSGLVGRYGGDEFIIVDFVHNDYDSMHKFLEGFYDSELCGNSVFRQIIKVEQINLLITGTIGTANYPNNAQDFDDLFEKADKALYRGKMKGRNCFIIYVEEKHKDIDISKLIKEPLQTTFYNLANLIDSDHTLSDKFHEISLYIQKTLKISHVLIINPTVDYFDNCKHLNIDFEDYIEENNACVFNSVDPVYNSSTEFEKFIDETGIASLIVGKIVVKKHFYGYLLFGETNVQRIWQNEDLALLEYVVRLLGMAIFIEQKTK